MSAYSKNYFANDYVEAGDPVYLLSQSDGKPNQYSYQIESYVVTAVGRSRLTARPKDGGRPVKFCPIPIKSWPTYGLYLIRDDASGAWHDHLFLSRNLAELCKENLEKAEAERTAHSGGQSNAGKK